jgi:hypothetical protein
MTVTVDPEGKHRKDVSVFVYYSDRESDLGTISDNLPHGRASCRLGGNGILTGTFLFPHTVHEKPNILTQTELAGGEPPERRPTILEVLASPAGFGVPTPAYTVTDEHAKKFGAPTRVYCRVVVKVKNGSSTQTIRDEVRSFKMPRMLVIANLGDSYSAGEGAPNIEGATLEQRWDDEPCHRSSKTGQIRAIKQLRHGTPDVAMTFLNVACSGAEIDKGLLNPQEDLAVGGVVKKPQIKALEDWMAAHNRSTVDMMIMSAGGNNAGFGDAGVSCLLALLGDCRNDEALWARVQERLASLPDAYADLDNRLENLNIGRIFITEYPDPMRAENGRFCNASGNPLPGLCWGPVELAVSENDFRNLHDNLLIPLNNAVRAAATAHGWKYIGGTMEASDRNGVCNCDDPYFNVPGQAIFIQGDVRGSIHPNRKGHKKIYQPLVYDALSDQLKEMRKDAAKEMAKDKIRQRREETATLAFVKKSTVIAAQRASLPRPVKLFPAVKQENVKAVKSVQARLEKDDALDKQKDPSDDSGQ